MVGLEQLGLSTAAVATEPFIDEALEQARLLGMPEYRMVLIPHPVQLLTRPELEAAADGAFAGGAASVVGRASPGGGTVYAVGLNPTVLVDLGVRIPPRAWTAWQIRQGG